MIEGKWRERMEEKKKGGKKDKKERAREKRKWGEGEKEEIAKGEKEMEGQTKDSIQRQNLFSFLSCPLFLFSSGPFPSPFFLSGGKGEEEKEIKKEGELERGDDRKEAIRKSMDEQGEKGRYIRTHTRTLIYTWFSDTLSRN